MKRYIAENSFINLNHRERKSIFFMILLLVVSILIYGFTLWWPRKQIYSIAKLNEIRDDTFAIRQENGDSRRYSPEEGVTLYSFDPNTITKSELEKFGLSAKISAIWTNYTSKGGRFKSSADLKKIFGLKPAEIEKLMPYVQIKNDPSSIPKSDGVKVIDLNTTTYTELIRIGMPSRVAGTLLKYRTGGKSFKSINDLMKVIGMNDSILAMVAPFIRFQNENEAEPDDKSTEKSPSPIESASSRIVQINLNKADTTELKYLTGIGSKLAFRIVKYRDHLGGFYSINQLKEIYGLPDSTFTKISSKLIVDENLKKIQVNNTDFTKQYHPYIDKKQAIIIQNFIKQHYPIEGLEDLKKIEILDLLFWNKVEPYLDFTHK